MPFTKKWTKNFPNIVEQPVYCIELHPVVPKIPVYYENLQTHSEVKCHSERLDSTAVSLYLFNCISVLQSISLESINQSVLFFDLYQSKFQTQVPYISASGISYTRIHSLPFLLI